MANCLKNNKALNFPSTSSVLEVAPNTESPVDYHLTFFS